MRVSDMIKFGSILILLLMFGGKASSQQLNVINNVLHGTLDCLEAIENGPAEMVQCADTQHQLWYSYDEDGWFYIVSDVPDPLSCLGASNANADERPLFVAVEECSGEDTQKWRFLELLPGVFMIHNFAFFDEANEFEEDLCMEALDDPDGRNVIVLENCEYVHAQFWRISIVL